MDTGVFGIVLTTGKRFEWFCGLNQLSSFEIVMPGDIVTTVGKLHGIGAFSCARRMLSHTSNVDCGFVQIRMI
jgi:hypothetical protein